MSFWFAEKENIIFILFVLSLVLIAFLIYDLFYSSIAVTVIIGIAFLIALISRKSLKIDYLFLLSLFRYAYSITFALALALLAFLLASNMIFLLDKFIYTNILVILLSFPFFLVLVFSLIFLEKKFSEKRFYLGKILSKSILISIIPTVIIFFAAVFGQVYLYQTNLVASSNTYFAEICRSQVVDACKSCYYDSGSILSCPVTTYLTSESDKKCLESGYNTGDFAIRNNLIRCQNYVSNFTGEVGNLELYKEIEDYRIQLLSSAEKRKSEGEKNFEIQNSVSVCLSDCADEITEGVESILNLAVGMYSVHNREATIGSEYRVFVEGFSESYLDTELEKIKQERGVDLILFNPKEEFADEYFEKIRREVDAKFDPPVRVNLTFDENSVSTSAEIGQKLAKNLPIGENSMISVLLDSKRFDLLPTLNRVLIYSSLGKGIVGLAFDANSLYASFERGGDVLNMIYENKDKYESFQSKYIRYRILYFEMVSKNLTKSSGA